MNRAYSFLEIKSVDEEQRELIGIATTPTTDRVGDIVEPKGAQFKLPIPLLWQHDAMQPVGHVTHAKVTAAGIEVRAKLVRIDEPGALKNRLDEAWQSIKSGLVRGLSIGFKPLESARIEDSFGMRFSKWLWLELSPVTIAANGDASILSIKSIDTQLRAASGQSQRVVRLDSPAGVSAQKSTPQEGKSMNTAENIRAFEAKLLASSERMEAIMAKAADEGRTLDESETQDFEDAEGEVATCNKHLAKLRSLESIQASKAKPVKPVETVDAGASLRNHVITVESRLEKGIEFVRLIQCLAASRFDRGEALEMAKARFPDNPRISSVLRVPAGVLKAAVAAGTTTDATWAGPFVEYQTLASEFIEFLRPMTILGKFGQNGIPALNNIPFNVRILMETSGGDGWWVQQGAAKPVTAGSYDAITMPFAKVANISVITDELARFSSPSAELRVRSMLAKALQRRLDIDFIDPDKAAVSNESPASITNGVAAIPSSGTSINDVHSDVEAIFGAFIAANMTPSSGVWIMSATTALALSMMRNPLGQREFDGLTMNGGTFVGLPVITSEYVPAATAGSLLILVNAADILLADDGQVSIDASREASIEMLDNPTGNSATGTATQLVSMWQTNSIALKAERFIYWKRSRDAAVQYVENVAYTSAQPSV